MKYLLLIVFGLVVWWLWQKSVRARARAEQPPRERPAESMVACAHCGVLLPESDSLAGTNGYYCCEAHRQAGRRPTR